MLWHVVTAALTLAYPLALWLGTGHFEPRWLAALLLLVVLLRLPALRTNRVARWAAVAALLMVAIAVANNALLPLKFYPALVNGVMLGVFGMSLMKGMPVIERLARLREPDLPAIAVRYTRRVTQAWCVFFVLNGAAALATTLQASDEVWMLYNGLISYLLMGAMFAGEYLLRLRFKRMHHV